MAHGLPVPEERVLWFSTWEWDSLFTLSKERVKAMLSVSRARLCKGDTDIAVPHCGTIFSQGKTPLMDIRGRLIYYKYVRALIFCIYISYKYISYMRQYISTIRIRPRS
jgi:hypothetical protein